MGICHVDVALPNPRRPGNLDCVTPLSEAGAGTFAGEKEKALEIFHVKRCANLGLSARPRGFQHQLVKFFTLLQEIGCCLATTHEMEAEAQQSYKGGRKH